MVRQLARYRRPHATRRFHRARLGGTTTGPLPSAPRHTPFPPSSSRWYDNWPATVGRTPHAVSTELVSVVRQLARYSRPHATRRFHRARLGGTTTGPLQSAARHTPFPPSSSRWYDNWPATVGRSPHAVSTELVSVVRQLARYSRPHATRRFHRARLGGTTTGPLQSAARHTPFPPSLSRWYDNWPATVGRTPHAVSTELVSVVRQLARYSSWPVVVPLGRAQRKPDRRAACVAGQLWFHWGEPSGNRFGRRCVCSWPVVVPLGRAQRKPDRAALRV